MDLKLDALRAARFDEPQTEVWRKDIVEWLSEAAKTKATRQPALYLGALNDLGEALNSLPTDQNAFKQYIANRSSGQPHTLGGLEKALRELPLPAPKELKAAYFDLLDKEVEARTARLDELEERVSATEESLSARLEELAAVSEELGKFREEAKSQSESIATVAQSAEKTIADEWEDALDTWKRERKEVDDRHNAEALEHVATLAATRHAAEVLAEHAAGDLSATDWSGRAKRERRAAQWIRFGAAAAFVLAGAVGWYIVHQAIRNDFDLTLGDGVLRSTVAIVIGAFGGLLLRESSRHFREADTAEDVALSLKALAPFYANSEKGVKQAARTQLGDAVLVKSVLSRFAHRDAAKHSGDVKAQELSDLVNDSAKALNLAADGEQKK